MSKLVYHVANPTIAGITVGEPIVGGPLDEYIRVIFERKMSFSGNPDRFDREWMCNVNLLYETPRLAFENSWEGKRDNNGILKNIWKRLFN